MLTCYTTHEIWYAHNKLTNDGWKASTSRTRLKVSRRWAIEYLFSCLSGQQFIFYVFFIFTDWNISRCAPKRLSYLSLRFFFRQRLLLLFLLLWNERVDTIILCIHNVILSNPILTCCRIFWARSEKCSNNHKCRRFVCICKKAELYGIVMCCAAMFLIKMFVSFFKWFKNVAKSYSGFCCYSIGTCQFPCI